MQIRDVIRPIVAGLLVVPISVMHAQSGPSAGTKIGTMVKDAVTTALPSVKSIVDLFWTKPDDAKIKKEDLTNAVIAARKALQDSITLKAQSSLRPVQTVSNEIFVLNKFLEPSVSAMTNLARIEARSMRPTPLTNADWAENKTDWEVAREQLKKLDQISGGDLNVIRDLWLRQVLSKIRELNGEAAIRANSKLEQRDAAGFSTAVQNVSSTLNDFSGAIGYELTELNTDLEGLSQWARGPGGGTGSHYVNMGVASPTAGASAQQKAFRALLANKYGVGAR